MIAFLASGELTRSSGQTARSKAHREARERCDSGCLGMLKSSARVGATWARWRAEERNVKHVSARHEQAKRGVERSRSSTGRARSSIEPCAICHNIYSCRVLSRHFTLSGVVSLRADLLRQDPLSLHCSTWHLESRLSFSRSRPSARHIWEGSMSTVKFTRERMIYYSNSTMDSVRKLRESNTATQNNEQVHTNNSTF